MDKLLATSQYFPPTFFFAQAMNASGIIVEAYEHYQKQTLRNRCHILTSSGVQMLIIPIIKPTSRLIKDIKIDYSQRWQHNHLRAIQTAYGKAPYYEHYIDLFSKTIMSNQMFLFDINTEILTLCLKILKFQTEINFTSSFTNMHMQGINDMRDCKRENTGFVKELCSKPIPYFQLFGNKFVDNLSIIDLIFNEGTNAKYILSNS